MPTEKQLIQRELFLLKGSLNVAKVIVDNAIKCTDLPKNSIHRLTTAYAEVDVVLCNLDTEVGWKEEVRDDC